MSIEHRDGSGPRTFINLPRPQTHEDLAHKAHENDIDVASDDRKNGFSKMDYVFPKGNKKDTMPGNKQGVDGELRSAQIQLRLAEIEEAYHVMKLLCTGRGSEIEAANLRNKADGAKGGSRRALHGVDWDAWKDRFHLEQVTMLGHSFGAATTIEVLRHKDRFEWVGQGIIYDIWGAAIQPPEEKPGHRIHTPLLGINSEAFVYWPDNFGAVMKLCKEAKEQGQLAWLMTVRGSVHISQSDFSILYPWISSVVLKMTCNPRRAIDLNVNASLEFLRQVMPERMSRMNRGTDEKLLEVSKLDNLPDERKPNEKWMAVRLRIPHELRVRMTPTWVRRRARARVQEGKEWPRDERGNALVGLQDLGPGEEVWMHVAPTKDELAKHGLSPNKELEGRDEETGMAGGGDAREAGARGGDHREEARSPGHRSVEQRYMERG